VTNPIRVLIADDSAFARKVLREVLSGSPGIEVVGTARDGLEALERIAELSPDVLTLDLLMPNLDGLGVLAGLPKEGAPRVIVVSISGADSELGAAALAAGAIDIVHKPTALATQLLYDLGKELVAKVRIAALARQPRSAAASLRVLSGLISARTHDIVVVGTSTGGPQALTRLIMGLPGDFPVPLVIALHIPPGYTEALAARLNDACAIEVREAAEGIELRPGLALVAPGGTHVRLLRSQGVTRAVLDHRLGAADHAPSVDFLFESAADQFAGKTLGVVLTGMGDDGTRGAGAIHRAGGVILTEAEVSCVVYGMPRAAKEAGYSTAEAPIEAMAAAIVRHL
jgi:two-component system, chemotaxis family, protein-glutamate methylesterase/glutaminase